MKIRLLTVGKPRDPAIDTLHERYADRIRRLGADYRADWVPDTPIGKQYSDAHVREREAAALRRALGPGERLVALDPSGRLVDTEKLARRLERWSTGAVTFAVGGPLGLEPAFRDSAEWTWSLSPLTFPHELVRVLVAEQVYRAMTLLRGIPYHK